MSAVDCPSAVLVVARRPRSCELMSCACSAVEMDSLLGARAGELKSFPDEPLPACALQREPKVSLLALPNGEWLQYDGETSDENESNSGQKPAFRAERRGSTFTPHDGNTVWDGFCGF